MAEFERNVSVFRSTQVNDMYVFVDAVEGIDVLPDPLRRRFGKGVPAFDFVLTPERSLARVTAQALHTALERDGYYLQMPPPADQSPDALLDRGR